MDGRYHLYLNQTPQDFDKGLFNFVLGAHANPVPLVLGFVENATYGVSELPKNVLQRRAQEVFALNETNDLGTLYSDFSTEQIAEKLAEEATHYRVSVAPQDLHILTQPVPIPSDIYEVTFPGYRPLPMTEDQYSELKERVLHADTHSSVEQEEESCFPEGRLIENLHKSRERNQTAVEKAKKQFIHNHGRLFCEACDFEPEEHFGSKKLRNRIIEAHHDLWLSDPKHSGRTKYSDLKMLCPTCHRAIHTIRPWLKVKQLRAWLRTDE